ncbi:MAG: hypothetical protein Q9P14_02515 [candidate division KSB1 bacterium]|nr:hypothetical protein [candidate division KSB1 bacterium]
MAVQPIYGQPPLPVEEKLPISISMERAANDHELYMLNRCTRLRIFEIIFACLRALHNIRFFRLWTDGRLIAMAEPNGPGILIIGNRRGIFANLGMNL